MKKSNIIKVLFIIILIVLLVFSIIIVNKKYNKSINKKETDKTNVTENKPKEEEKHYEANLIAVGDNLIHSSVYRNANKLANYNGYDFKPMIKYIKEITQNYDIAYYNQETILGGTELGLSDYPTFNTFSSTNLWKEA